MLWYDTSTGQLKVSVNKLWVVVPGPSPEHFPSVAVDTSLDTAAAGQLQVGPVNATSVAIRGPQKSLVLGEALTTPAAGNQTLTAAQLLGGVIEHPITAATTDTTDTGTNLDAAIPNVANGDSFVCQLINTGGAFAITIAAGVGVTLKGSTTTVAQNKTAVLLLRRTGVAAWTCYVTVSA